MPESAWERKGRQFGRLLLRLSDEARANRHARAYRIEMALFRVHMRALIAQERSKR